MTLVGPGDWIPDPPEKLVAEWRDDLITGQPSAWAVFSEDRTYRYLLAHQWASGGNVLTWVMLNPSDADAFRNDPTVGRVIKFTRREGYDGVRILNEYGLRSPDPAVLRAAGDPIGPSNDQMISHWTRECPVVVAWGGHSFAAARAREVLALIDDARLLCLGTTQDGSPIHPLARGRARVPDDAPLLPWPPRIGHGPDRAVPVSPPPPVVNLGKGNTAGGGRNTAQLADWGRAVSRQHADARRRVTQPASRRPRGLPSAGPGMIRRPPPGGTP